MVSDLLLLPLWARRRQMFGSPAGVRVAYLHVRQPYLERAEDLFDERAGPPVEFGVPRSFSGLGDMIASREPCTPVQSPAERIRRVRATRWSAHEAAARLDLTGS